jgi:alpha-beta hydrolase superfamily lysophospholipase
VSEQRFTVAVGAADVAGVLHLPDELPSACVIACHGMGASKDSDKYLLLGRELPAAGLALARFDFRGSGESGGLPRDATIESRIADLEGSWPTSPRSRSSTAASGCWARASAGTSRSGRRAVSHRARRCRW